MIHVCFSLHDKTGRYSKFTGTTILSVFENTNSDVTAHILHDNTLTQENRDKFIYLAGRYGQIVKFYNVEKLCAEKLAEIISLAPDSVKYGFTVGALYRLLITQLLPKDIDKIIYLDSDIVVNLDINELWQIDISEYPLGAVPVYLQDKNRADGLRRMQTDFDLPGLGFVKDTDYFNAGVFVMNLKYLRGAEEKILSGMKFRSKHPEFRMFDQCIWNYCFSTQALKLPTKFNREVFKVRTQDGGIVEKKIYHYTANNSYWSFGMDMSDDLNRLWMNYFTKTPWFNAESIGHLYETISQTDIALKKSMINISAAVSGKTRAFIAFEKDVNVLVEIFSVHEDEEIFTAKNDMPIQNFINAINASRGEKIFFILLPNFPFKILTDAGFIEGKDFVNAVNFLSAANGVQMDSYPFIDKM